MCIACGHCVAACPTAALDNSRAPLAGQQPLAEGDEITRQQAAQFIRSRRSVRCYLDKPVARAEVEALLDLVRHAASGTNAQGVGWVAIQNEETLQKICDTTVDYMAEVAKEDSNFGRGMAMMEGMMRLRGERQGVLRNAPCLIVSTASRKLTPARRENAIVAQTTLELYAPALGLGSCWCGFLELALLAPWPPLIELLGLPERRVAAGAVMLGHPKYHYHRMTDHKPTELTWIE